ncbi:hypothetical protein [Streptosporangium sp. NPDC006007]|uniref:hypothetical protein n=1 Tax=Streptosporangium sp. NPDC006007 TaxID=3154575 RepID=UPI0033BB1085
MSTPTGAGRVAPGTGPGAAWVSEHGAHLMDYAASHLTPGQALSAVVSAMTACGVRPPPEGVSVRGRLLAVLRRDCLAAPGYRERYVPDSGPGMPDDEVIERVWTIVDPLGTEALRLVYRHGLPVEDLPHVLGVPPEDAGRLVTRTQDLIEILASGLDSLANRRRTCPELAPLAEAVFPDEEGPLPSTGYGDARAQLLSHMVKCPVCTRPINIRYTAPQMISNPRLRPLTAKIKRRLVDALSGGVDPSASGLGTPFAAPVAVADPRPAPASAAPAAQAREPAPAPREKTRPTRQDRSTLPYQPVRPASPSRQDHQDQQDRPVRQNRADRRDHPDGGERPGGRDRRDRSRLPYGPALQDRPTLPSLPRLPAQPAGPPSASPSASPPIPPSVPPSGSPPGSPSPAQDTPLYDALLSRAWSRETPARPGDADFTVPSMPAIPSAAGGPANRRASAARAHAGPEGEETRERFGSGVRVLEALAWVGDRIRSTTIKIMIIVVAGAAGTLTGMNLLAPAIGVREPTSSLRSSAAQENTPETMPGEASGTGGGLSGRLRIPPVVTLDEFGQGSMLLTVTGPSLTWRISAPGLTVHPAGGTSNQGHTEVITLRAHRIRHWCGTPSLVTTPLTVRGPTDSISTTVRWQTC